MIKLLPFVVVCDHCVISIKIVESHEGKMLRAISLAALSVSHVMDTYQWYLQKISKQQADAKNGQKHFSSTIQSLINLDTWIVYLNPEQRG